MPPSPLRRSWHSPHAVRCVRVSGALVTPEMLARACAEVAARAPFAARTGPVFVVVNGVDVGPVPSGVWERVQERIVSILDEHVTIQEEPHAPAHAEAAADP